MNEDEKVEKDDKNESKQKRIDDLQQEAQVIYKQFEAAQSYKNNKGILEQATRAVNFYEGNQWGDFKGKLPFEKPSINIIQNVVDGKAASINQKIFKINFIVDNDNLSTNKISKFTDYQLKEMQHEDIILAATYDTLLKGTGIWYEYWNEDKEGVLGNIEGSLEASIIDIEDIAFSNPTEKNVQKQEWIIIRSRESVKFVKDSCTTLTDKEKDEYIQSDSVDTKYTNNIDQKDEEMCYSYMKMFKKDGEVYFEKATRDIVYQEPTSLNPLTNEKAIKKSKKELEDNEDNDVYGDLYEKDSVNRHTMQFEKNNDLTEDEAMEQKYKANQYPINVLTFLERNNCIFGLSFAYQLIPQQKLINQLIAANTLCAIKQAQPSVLVKAGALGTANVDFSKPNGIITDYSGYGVNDAIKLLSGGTVPTAQFELAQAMISMTKDVYRANDILNDGRSIASDMSGTAISQLNAIKDMPIAQWQQKLSRTIAREGKILEMFYKLFYHNKRFSYQLTDSELLDVKSAFSQNNPNMPQAQIDNVMTNSQTGIFNGEDYLDTPFNITVEVGETSRYSELVLSATLETLFLNGTIANLSAEDLMMYAELVPDYIFPKKNEFKRLLVQKQNSVVMQLQQTIEQQQQQMQQMQLQQQALQQAYTDRINQYNEKLGKLGTVAKEMQREYNTQLQNERNRANMNLRNTQTS